MNFGGCGAAIAAGGDRLVDGEGKVGDTRSEIGIRLPPPFRPVSQDVCSCFRGRPGSSLLLGRFLRSLPPPRGLVLDDSSR